MWSCATQTAALAFTHTAGSLAEGLRFTVGVPADVNHADPTLAAPPLNRSDMFWVWQQGYKFLSLESAPLGVFHLGSTGCSGPAPVRPPDAPCARPNRLTVTLDSFDAESDFVGIRAAALLSGLGGPQRCTGNYAATPGCLVLLSSLDLDPDTGQCGLDCGTRLFASISR